MFSKCSYNDWFQHAPCGMIYQKILLNEEGRPVDLLILATNLEFEKLFGLARDETINAKLSTVLPMVFQSQFPWMEYLYHVAQGVKVECFEHYSESLNRWYRLTICPEGDLHFTCMVVDITTSKIMMASLKFRERCQLSDIIELQAFQSFQDDFAQAFNVALVLVDIAGKMITTASNFVSMQADPLGDPVNDFDLPGCWWQKVAVMVSGHHLGDLYVGQVRRIPEVSFEGPIFDVRFERYCHLSAMTKRQFDQMLSLLVKLVSQLTSRAYLILQQVELLEHQKKIEQELLAKNNFISSFLQAIPIPVFYQDLEGKYLGHNHAFTEVVGDNPQLQKTFGKAMTDSWKELRIILAQQDPEQINKHRHQRYELVIKNKDHQLRDVIFERDVFLGANGHIDGMVGAFVDITERKRAEQLLKNNLKEQEMLRSISENFINVPLEEIDLAINRSLQLIGSFANVDRAYLFRYDFTTNTISNTYEWCQVGISCEIQGQQNVPFDSIYPQLKKHMNGQYFTINDVELFGHDVSKVFSQLLADQSIKSIITYPIQSGSNLMGFVGFDAVTEPRIFTEEEANLLADYSRIIVNLLIRANTENSMKKIVQTAQQANKSKTEFISNISHEIRTPLNIIIGFHELLKTTALDSNQSQYVQDACYAARSMLEIVNDLLDLAKMDAGKLELKETMVNLPELVINTAKLFQPLADKKGLKLITSIFPSVPPYVMVDGNRLKQVLMNLMANAIKFTNQGEVEVKLLFQSLVLDESLSDLDFQGAFTFVVRDTGVGIRKDQQATIFQRFMQIESNSHRRQKGSGLGLAISSSLVEKMGSLLHVTSEVDLGSTFFFSLNRHYKGVLPPNFLPIDQATSDLSPIRPPAGEKGVATILIAEDNEASGRLLATIIRKIVPDCELVTAMDGVIALELFNKHRPQLMFMDVQMAEMDGISCTKKIRAQEHLAGHEQSLVRIVAITGGVSDEERRLCLDAGMDAVLTKPISFQELDGVLKGFLFNS